MPLTFVSSAHSPNGFEGKVSKAVTAGNHLFIGAIVGLSVDIEATGVTDNQGNTWVRDAAGNTANRHMAIFRTIAGATGTVNAQLVVSGTLDSNQLELAEFSGSLDASPFDAASSIATGSGTALASNTVTPSQADCFLLGMGGVDYTGTSLTPDAPWVDRTASPGERAHLASREVSSIAAYSLTGTLSASESWGALVAAYKFPGGGGGGGVPPFRGSVTMARLR
jgi:hypothetical protein